MKLTGLVAFLAIAIVAASAHGSSPPTLLGKFNPTGGKSEGDSKDTCNAGLPLCDANTFCCGGASIPTADSLLAFGCSPLVVHGSESDLCSTKYFTVCCTDPKNTTDPTNCSSYSYYV